MIGDTPLSERGAARKAAIDAQRLVLPDLRQQLRFAERAHEQAAGDVLLGKTDDAAVDAAEAEVARIRGRVDRLLLGLTELGDGALPGWASPHYR